MKYFVISDIHSYYDAMIKALGEAGYDKKSKNHFLIVCGDIFDRGPDPIKVYKFLKSIPKSRKALIKGNHEFCLKEICDRGFFYKHDLHNKTADTIYYFTLGMSYMEALENVVLNRLSREDVDSYKLIQQFKSLPVYEWLNSKEWKYYYELDNYIFVHNSIPLKTQYDKWGYILTLGFNENWRKCDSDIEWDEAVWGCSWKNCLEGYYDNLGKILVVGHWHTSDFFKNLSDNIACNKCEENMDIFYSKKIIGIDACTAITNKCNVLVIDEDGKCYNRDRELIIINN